MRVLVDTSVWSLAFRKKGAPKHPSVERLATLIGGQDEVVMLGVILQEILQQKSDSGTNSNARWVANQKPKPCVRVTE